MKTIFGEVWVLILLGWLCASSVSHADPLIVWGSFNVYGSSTVTNVPANATNVIELAAGDTHCLALRTDGTVVAWGTGGVGQTNVPPDLTNAVSVAAGSTHSLALRSDGSLAAWGAIFPSSLKISVPPQATNVVALALGPGAQHALVLKADGTPLDWSTGYNASSLTNIPAKARNVVAVASGAYSGLALRSDGRPVTWGTGMYGSGTPIPVPATATNIVAIATSWGDYAALRADGTILAWGSSWGSSYTPPPNSGFTNIIDLAALGSSSDILALRRNGTMVEIKSSVPKYPTNMITTVGAGSYAGFAVTGSGSPVFPGLPVNRTVASGSRVYFRMLAVGAMPISYQWTCTGTNLPGATNSILVLTNVQPNLAGSIYSLIASNTFGMVTSGPVMLNENPSEAYITATATAAVVNQTVTFTGSMIGQGPFTYQWQLNGTNLPAATNLVLTLTNAQPTDAGGYSLLASNSYGIVTNYASLTVAPTIITSLPQNQVAFPGGTASFNLGLQAIIPVTYQWQTNGVNLDGATNSSLNLTNTQYAQGGTYSVIFNDAFETITNSATLAVVPVAAWGDIGQQSVPTGLTNVIALATGLFWGMALESDGSLITWQKNAIVSPTAPPGVTNLIAIAAGNNDSLALAGNGSVFAWGNNSYGQTNVPAGLTNVVAIAAGDFHNLALKSDGTVVAWGSNSNGQTNVPAGLTNVVAIAAGIYNSLALSADGTVVAWGSISNVPQNVTNVIQITSGGVDDLVLKADGSLVGWGDNNSGEDNIPAGLSNVVAIAAGYGHSAALQADGTVIAWGLNQYGEINIPSGLTNVTSLTAKGFHNIVLIGNGPPILQVAISNCVWTASGFQYDVPSQSGRVYALEYKDSLTDGNWSALPLVAGNGGVITLTDPTATHSQRFYRVRRW
jgi:alpha-tubulin suppressor-like RCC1 family protein